MSINSYVSETLSKQAASSHRKPGDPPSNHHRTVIEETFSVAGTPNLDVRIPSGRIEIRESKSGVVRVTADTRDPDFYIEQRGNTIVIASEKNGSWFTRGSSYVEIETPPGSDAYLGTASAEVEAYVALGKVEIKSASGDAEVESAETLIFKSASGDVQVTRVGHDLRFTSASGDLEVTESLDGSGNISTASGDVQIVNAEENLNVSTVSGDVNIERCVGRMVQLKSMSGSFEVGIPKGTSVDLDVNLLSGRLELPEPDPEKHPVERSMTLKVKSVSGDLQIERLD